MAATITIPQTSFAGYPGTGVLAQAVVTGQVSGALTPSPTVPSYGAWRARGLPPGVTLDSSSGLLSGNLGSAAGIFRAQIDYVNYFTTAGLVYDTAPFANGGCGLEYNVITSAIPHGHEVQILKSPSAIWALLEFPPVLSEEAYYKIGTWDGQGPPLELADGFGAIYTETAYGVVFLMDWRLPQEDWLSGYHQWPYTPFLLTIPGHISNVLELTLEILPPRVVVVVDDLAEPVPVLPPENPVQPPVAPTPEELYPFHCPAAQLSLQWDLHTGDLSGPSRLDLPSDSDAPGYPADSLVVPVKVGDSWPWGIRFYNGSALTIPGGLDLELVVWDEDGSELSIASLTPTVVISGYYQLPLTWSAALVGHLVSRASGTPAVLLTAELRATSATRRLASRTFYVWLEDSTPPPN